MIGLAPAVIRPLSTLALSELTAAKTGSGDICQNQPDRKWIGNLFLLPNTVIRIVFRKLGITKQQR